MQQRQTFVLEEVDFDSDPTVLFSTVSVQPGLGMELRFVGYGEKCAALGQGAPVYIEYYQGKLVVRVWADINSEEPTHVIDLTGALESNRKDENE